MPVKLRDMISQTVEAQENLSKYMSMVPVVYKRTNSGYLESAVEIAYYMYVMDDRDGLETLLDTIGSIEPTSDKRVWGWVEQALVLTARICREQGGQSERIASIQETIRAALLLGGDVARKVNPRVFERSMRGEHLDTKNIDRAVAEGDLASEADYRSLYLMELIKIREMGASETFTVDDAEALIVPNIKRLREIVDEVGLKKLIPFHS